MLNISKKGFSLIELMMIVAVIGVLANVGIPAYNNYIERKKIVEFLSSIEPIKSVVVKQINSRKLKICKIVSGKLTQNANYSISDDCDITVIGINELSGYSVNYKAIFLNGVVSWDCAGFGVNAENLFPDSCKGSSD